MNTIRITKHSSKVLKWIQSAISKDKNRPALQGINKNEDFASADGWRVHMASGLDGFPEGLYEYGKIPAEGIIEEPELIEGSFPDILQIIPRKEPVFEIAVNPKFLIDALKGLLLRDSMVILRFYADNEPIEVLGNIETKDESTPGYALVMPIDLNTAKQDITWKP